MSRSVLGAGAPGMEGGGRRLRIGMKVLAAGMAAWLIPGEGGSRLAHGLAGMRPGSALLLALAGMTRAVIAALYGAAMLSCAGRPADAWEEEEGAGPGRPADGDLPGCRASSGPAFRPNPPGTTGAAPELSVIAPLHDEEENVRPLFSAIVAALEPLRRAFEVVLVNDGSNDATGEILEQLALGDPRLHPVHLDRNYGQAAALSAGFEAARGSILLTLDGDLQNDPADLPRLLALLEEGGYRVVSGWRRQRQEQYARRVLPSRVANWLIGRITGLPSRDNGCSLKAYRSEVVKGVYLPHGLHRFIPAIYGVRPDEYAQTAVAHHARRAGRSHYGLSRVFAVLRDLLTVPYVLRGPRAWLHRMTGLALVAALLGLGCLAALATAQWPAALALGPVSVLLAGYSLGVRANLARWLRVQQDRGFRACDRRQKPASSADRAAAGRGGREVARATRETA